MPLPLLAIGAGLGLAGNIFSGVQGIRAGNKQMELSQQMLDQAALLQQMERPEFVIPEAIRKSVDIAQGRQYQRLPGADIFQNQLEKSTAAGVGAIGEMSSGAEAIGALSNLYANQMGQQSDLAAREAAYRDQAQREYIGSLEGLGEWEQRKWQWEEADPYLQAQQAAAQLQTAGMQGQWEGLKTRMGSWGEMFQGIGNTAASTLPMMQYAGMFGGGGTTPPAV